MSVASPATVFMLAELVLTAFIFELFEFTFDTAVEIPAIEVTSALIPATVVTFPSIPATVFTLAIEPPVKFTLAISVATVPIVSVPAKSCSVQFQYL